MNTDDLIESLARDLKPTPRGQSARRMALGVGAGAVVTLALVAWTLGFNPDLARAVTMHAFWVKWGYSLSLGAIALLAVARLGRPEAPAPRGLWLLSLPVLLLAAIGVAEMIHTPRSAWMALWLGKSWTRCPWLVLSLAMPIFIGLLWSFRRMAPTRLRAAGAAAGLSAGAIAATLYCLHCPEMSALFVLTWYSLGILLAAAVGALVGPRFLRW